MTAPFQTWTVLPHGALTAVANNLRTVVGELPMPTGGFPRRMTLARLIDGRLVVFNGIALDEREMAGLEAFGTPAFLIIPNDHHRQDAPAWKARYPAIRVIAPEAARETVEKVVAVDATSADFADPAVRLITVPGTRGHEFALEVDSDDGTTLVLNDIVGNIQGKHGFGGWLLKLMKFAGDEPQVPEPVKLAIVGDKDELKAQLLRWAALPRLKRILVSHGAIIDEDPPAVLRTLATSLD